MKQNHSEAGKTALGAYHNNNNYYFHNTGPAVLPTQDIESSQYTHVENVRTFVQLHCKT